MTLQTPKSLVHTLQDKYHQYDPRLELDKTFWSHIRHTDNHAEIEQWCNDTLGAENWYRMFNKYWFTSESDCVMFRLIWATGVNDERYRIQT